MIASGDNTMIMVAATAIDLIVTASRSNMIAKITKVCMINARIAETEHPEMK